MKKWGTYQLLNGGLQHAHVALNNNVLKDPQHLMNTVTDTVPYTDSRQNNNNKQLTYTGGEECHKEKNEK